MANTYKEFFDFVDKAERDTATHEDFSRLVLMQLCVYRERVEQGLHLTDGILRDLLASATPEQLSAIKVLLTPPIGR